MNIGILGISGHYGAVLQALQADPSLRLTAWATLPGEESQPLPEEAAPLLCSAAQLLATPGLAVAVVNAPCGSNTALSLAALQKGAACYSEKPAATAIAQLGKLAPAALAGQYTNMFEMRCMPAYQAAYNAARTGALGKIQLVQAQKSYKLGSRPAWYHSRESYGGTIPWVGSHVLDLAAWICGEALTPLWARHSAVGNGGQGSLEASAAFACALSGGGMATFSIDLLRPACAPTHGDDRLRIVGTKAILEVAHGKALLLEEAGQHTLPLPQPLNPFALFVEQLRGGTTSPFVATPAECLAVAEASLMLRDMADGQAPVSL